jgi:hypothetical protein
MPGSILKVGTASSLTLGAHAQRGYGLSLSVDAEGSALAEISYKESATRKDVRHPKWQCPTN